jgi:hypothetical protein
MKITSISISATILALGLGFSAMAQTQQAPLPAQPQASPTQQQQQMPTPPPSVSRETFGQWQAEIRRERGQVSQTRAWAQSTAEPRDVSFGFIWAPETAQNNPTLYLTMPEVWLRDLRDRLERDRGLFIEVGVRILEARQANPRFFALRNFQFFGDNSIIRSGGTVISRDLMQALWIASELLPLTYQGEIAGNNSPQVELDVRVLDEDGRMTRIFQRSFLLNGVLRATLRAQNPGR